MRAVICRAWGAVEDLTLEDIPRPTPGPRQALIDVKATGVNYADPLMVVLTDRKAHGKVVVMPEFRPH
jgi:NADPH2:quinone reductase